MRMRLTRFNVVLEEGTGVDVGQNVPIIYIEYL